MGMDISTITVVLVLGLVFLLSIGMPLGFASAVMALLVGVMKFEPTLLTNPVSFFEFNGILSRPSGMNPLFLYIQKVMDLLTEYVLLSVPLFIFMAALLERSGIAKSMYDSFNYWLSGFRGGIAIVTSLMAVILAAMSGIIGGEVVLLGLIALPQMLRLGYNQNLAIGTICASGSLGTMIPPSIVLIMYGVVTETSIKKLFTGAFLPGFMLASFIILYIIIRTQLQPSLAPKPEPKEGEPRDMAKLGLFITSLFPTMIVLMGITMAVLGLVTLVRVWYFGGVSPEDFDIYNLLKMFPTFGTILAVGLVGTIGLGLTQGWNWPMKGWSHSRGLVAPFVVIFIVMGSIYGGVTGITEAAGMGAFAVLMVAIIMGKASMDLVWVSLMRTLRSTGTIIWITVGAAMLAGAYTSAGGPQYIAKTITSTEMSTMMIIITMMIILLFMGAFMDWVGIVLLIIPVFLPIVRELPIEEIGYFGQLHPRDLAVWFGVVFCMNMQVSFLSPPFGPAAFYLKSVAPAHITLVDIFKGFLPFICVQICALAVLLIWPGIVTVLL